MNCDRRICSNIRVSLTDHKPKANEYSQEGIMKEKGKWMSLYM